MNDKIRGAIISLCVVLVIVVLCVFTFKKFQHDRKQAKIKAEQERKEPMLKYMDKMPSISDKYLKKESDSGKK